MRLHQLVQSSITLEDGNEIEADFLAFEGAATPLSGKATAEWLCLLKVGVCLVIGYDAYDDEVVRRFPKLWKETGYMKDVQVKLHIDNSVPSVPQKHSRVAFHRWEKVAKEIAKLEAADTIEKVSGPTVWVSRIVTPSKPKKPEEIRLCGDMREANKAIFRMTYGGLDELITAFNGATVFSKIDLRSGYHQMVLHPSGRH